MDRTTIPMSEEVRRHFDAIPAVAIEREGRKWRVYNPNAPADRSAVAIVVEETLVEWDGQDKYIDGDTFLAAVRRIAEESAGIDPDQVTDDLVVSILRDIGVPIEEVG